MITQWVSLLLICLFTNNFIIGQCDSEAYSTNAKDSWLSCQTSSNPNTNRANSHWLQYDLGYIYGLGETTFWNYNVANQTGLGAKQAVIDYSLDGINWTEADVFQLPEATGNEEYSGFKGIDLSGISARFILITFLSNWNGDICTGMSEVRFDVKEPNSTCGDFMVSQNIGDNPIIGGIYYEDNSILADGRVQAGTMVTFKSALSITLKPGFIVESGSEFTAKIESCNSLNTPTEMPNQARQANAILDNNQIITEINIYPNPAVNLLNIDFGNEIVTDLMIIDVAGHEVLRREVDQNFMRLDVSQLPAGMYLVNVLTNNQKLITKRFIKTGL